MAGRGRAESGDGDADWNIVLFGGFRAVTADERTVVERFRTQKALLLLARILLCAPTTVSREQLGEWLWPDRPPSDQRARLRYELSVLRSALGASAIRSVGNDFVTLGAGISCDVHEFRRAVAESRFADAAAVYAGDLLPGIYDDWILDQQTHLRAAARDAFLPAITTAQREGRLADARQLRRTLFERVPGLDEADAPLPMPPVPVLPVPTPAPPSLPPEPLLPAEGSEITLTPLIVPGASAKPRRTRVWRTGLRRAFPVLVGVGVYFAAVWAVRAVAPQWNFAADFSTHSPVFHNWSIGFLRLSDKTFRLMDRIEEEHKGALQCWYRRFEKGNINKNVSASPVYDFTARWKPGQTSLHPNGNKESACTAIRWNCPVAGAYVVHAHFSGISCEPNDGATVNVYAQRGPIPLWADEIRGSVTFPVHKNSRPAAHYDAVLPFVQNETLTCFADSAGAFACDQTGIDLTIRPLWAERLLSAAPLIALPLALFIGFAVYRRMEKGGM